MPGHKRIGVGMLPEELCRIDITEIDGFDNLHQPEEILRNLRLEAARIYGAEESFYLINGSTCGILSAVSSALPRGGHILMARNCHKAAYHAAYLRGLTVTYLYPAYLAEYDIFDAVEPWKVRQALEREPDIGAVLIVSPTYEGRISDIRAIADIVHEKGIPLIVDEAHGAHLGLAAGFSQNSCQLGADLVIHSVHKTLPAPTQTALLHVNGKRIDRERLRRFLRIYQSSSPSYLLMAGIDNALQYISTRGQEAFGHFRERYAEMMDILSGCRHLKFLPLSMEKQDSPAQQDIGKLLISVKHTGLTGKRLYDILRQEYHLQLEMASVSFTLAMFTVNDGEEAYRRMTGALLEIDEGLEKGRYGTIPGGAAEPVHEWENPQGEMAAIGKECRVIPAERTDAPTENTAKERVDSSAAIPLAIAWDMPAEPVALSDSIGKRTGEFINLYPPGVPLLVPGEQINEGLYRLIKGSLEHGLNVQGIEMQKGTDGKEDEILVKVIQEEDAAKS